MECSLPGSSIHEIFQARILERVTISFSRRSSPSGVWTWVSHIVGRRFNLWATQSLVSNSWQPHGYSPPDSSIHGILQARILEWGAISFSNAWKGKVKVKWLRRVRLLATTWTVAYQAPPSMGFSRQEYWSGVPLPSPKLSIDMYKYVCFTKHKQEPYF